MVKERLLRQEIHKVLYGDRDNPYLFLLRNLKLSPELSSVNSWEEAIVDSTVSQIVDNIPSVWLLKGSVLWGKTSIAGTTAEALSLISQRFGLPQPLYAAWEDDQEAAKSQDKELKCLTSGPRNAPGCYGDAHYQKFEQHYVETLSRGFQNTYQLISDSSHIVDHGEKAFDLYTGPHRPPQIQVNIVCVIPEVHLAPYGIVLRDQIEEDPENVEEILKKEGLLLPPKQGMIRGGGYIPTLEHTRLESNHLFNMVSQGTLVDPEVISPTQLWYQRNKIKFYKETYLPYLKATRSYDRFLALINKDHYPKVPPVFPILDELNIHKRLKL